MSASSSLPSLPGAWGRALWRHARSWWHMLHFGAVAVVLMLSPSSYDRARRTRTAHHIYATTWQVLPWFTVLAALLSLVLIRIVVVTAVSYGLSQYALEMVVRVLVLELIPLSAALFVTLRAGLAFNAGAAQSTHGLLPTTPPRGVSLERLRDGLLAQVTGNTFSVLALALVSSIVALLLAYVLVYGFSPWGLPGYTRTVGRVFEPIVAFGFALKTVLFALAVAVVPAAASLEPRPQGAGASTVQPGAVRLFLVLLLIEAASLTLRYF
ncbi:ABC transporter permease [Rhodoferax sp.]|uniref:ABC transporter permease n=1 Tax=Rhodoferax sp. TaxID=50421 RepID=UPI002767D26A|nr:ABC transporter permease [Rhodoferax sp.]